MSSRPPVIGLVGGVGSGKSRVARELVARLPGVVLDADAAGHRVLTRPEIKAQLRQRFGDGLFDDVGQIVRSRLAAQVFGDTPELVANRKALERIVHPAIRGQLQQELNAAVADPRNRVVIVDAALIFETDWHELVDGVAFVEVPRETRLARVQATRGWDAVELDRREASQVPVEEKRRRSAVVLDNSGDVSVAVDQLADFVAQLTRQSTHTAATALK